MNIEMLRQYCLSKAGTTESMPFGNGAVVFKVINKMYALIGLNDAGNHSISLKCNPDKAIELRTNYPAITGAYHMNKKHWNGIQLNNTVPDQLILDLIDHSYELVTAKLKKSDKELLAKMQQ